MLRLLLAIAISAVSARSQDMSAEFAKLKTCNVCIKAGYGWCPIKRRCGGFANKECGVGPQYVAEDYLKPKASKENKPQGGSANAKKASSPPKRASPSPPPPLPKHPAGGTDMSSIFSKLRDCGACTAAGYGWCPMQRKCGGFANKQCGIGPQYVAADALPGADKKASSGSAGAGKANSGAAKPARNGRWESKAERAQRAAEDAPPSFEVPPAAAPPPPASVLYAGPASPPASPPAAVVAAAVEPTGEVAEAVEATIASVAVEAANETAPASEARELLMRMPTAALVDQILELQRAVKALQA